MVQGVGAGLDDEVQGKGAGLDEMVQGMGAGLDKMVQAGTKPNVNHKTKSEDTKNGNIHTKIVSPKTEDEYAKEQVKEDDGEKNKDGGAAR